jgi:hypothetical protein
MARPFGGTVVDPLVSPRARDADPSSIAAAKLSAGMITEVDKADLPNEALTLAKNARVRKRSTIKRVGLKITGTPTAPDTARIVKLYADKRIGGRLLFRVVPPNVYYTDGGSWTQLTGTIQSGPDDPIFMATVLDKLVLANRVNKLQVINVDDNTISDLSDLAPRARYVTGAFNRVVAASTGSSAPGRITVYWSGDADLTQFDAAINISAGQSPIIDSPSDVTDYITGIFGFDNVLIIPRERSLWLATKQPFASNPFNFYNAVPGRGCNVPSSIANIDLGIAYLDLDSENVWAYRPGGEPEPIGESVRRELIRGITEPTQIFSTYLRNEREFMLGLPQTDGTIKIWVFNFKVGAWTYDEYPTSWPISTVAALSILTQFTSYDQLATQFATYDDITGIYDDLTSQPVEQTRLFYGRDDGKIYQESDEKATDDGDIFTMDLISKEFIVPSKQAAISMIEFEYLASVAGELKLEYSKDRGNNWITAKRIVTVADEETHLFKFKRSIRSRRIMWRLTAVTGLVEILNYDIRVAGDSESRN